jgi:DNA-binding XRE family transcriptional regulator
MRHPNHLGAQRKRWKLSKAELAQLLGYRYRSAVHHAEKDVRPATIKFALGCEIVFGKAARDLFPALFADIEDAVMRRAAKFDEKLRGSRTKSAATKRELLRSMVERAGSRSRV